MKMRLYKIIPWLACMVLFSFSGMAINATDSLFNLTPATGVNDVYGFVTAVNDLTGQIFMVGVLIVSFLILFAAFQRSGNSDALLGSGFVTTVLAVLFAAIDLVPPWIVFLIVIPYGAFFAYRVVRG